MPDIALRRIGLSRRDRLQSAAVTEVPPVLLRRYLDLDGHAAKSARCSDWGAVVAVNPEPRGQRHEADVGVRSDRHLGDRDLVAQLLGDRDWVDRVTRSYNDLDISRIDVGGYPDDAHELVVATDRPGSFTRMVGGLLPEPVEQRFPDIHRVGRTDPGAV